MAASSLNFKKEISRLPQPASVILLDCLGSGTYATVYKGILKNDRHTVVAVKCIERKKLTPRSADNLFTEIKLMKQLEHRHIVRLLDFEWNSEHIFLIMEYCGGGDLSHFIHSKRTLKESAARQFLRQLALAMQFLRAKGIAHMDLKPQNLLLTSPPKPVLKIGDFGMAQLLHADDHAASFRGSPLYMAPEIMLGRDYDAKVDLWSIGIILHEALFGYAPFASETLEELQMKFLEEAPIKIPALHSVSLKCKSILEGLLQRDPAQRMSFDEFFNDPYIDLEHMPGPDCIHKARELVKIAVAKDNDGKWSSAINYYCQALDYFMPALEYSYNEESLESREVLKQMVEQYIDRAKVLKAMLKSQRPSINEFDNSHKRLLDQMSKEIPGLNEVYELAKTADKLEEQQQYSEALEKYKEAVERLLPLRESVDTAEKKKIIAAQVQVFLQRAEELTMITEKSVPQLSRLSSSFKSTVTERCHVQ